MNRFVGLLSSSSSLRSGDTERVGGADFMASRWRSLGRGVEHISQEKKEGWLRNVQAGQGMVSGVVDRDGRPAREEGAELGDEETCRSKDNKVGLLEDGTDVRGTPHKAHIRAAAGLSPGGLR